MADRVLNRIRLRVGASGAGQTLSFQPGPSTVVVGPNNAGKSLFLREMATFAPIAARRSHHIYGGAYLEPSAELWLELVRARDAEGGSPDNVDELIAEERAYTIPFSDVKIPADPELRKLFGRLDQEAYDQSLLRGIVVHIVGRASAVEGNVTGRHDPELQRFASRNGTPLAGHLRESGGRGRRRRRTPHGAAAHPVRDRRRGRSA